MASLPPPAPDPVAVSAEQIRALDLTPLRSLALLAPSQLVERSGLLELGFTWPRPAEDPRELSEIAEVRLWSLRADAAHPWLPLLLERSGGTLTRHVAMLLPHVFSRNEGIRFAPDSLELWITHRLFLLDDWSRAAGLNTRHGLGQMAAVLGFELDPEFWSALPPLP
ncbi:MAG TPA: CRR6 family NdhI maturation factor [Cyanobium sp.]|nr:CRR6 family NdhI maturation factor [Cyanobium sp.]